MFVNLCEYFIKHLNAFFEIEVFDSPSHSFHPHILSVLYISGRDFKSFSLSLGLVKIWLYPIS